MLFTDGSRGNCQVAVLSGLLFILFVMGASVSPLYAAPGDIIWETEVNDGIQAGAALSPSGDTLYTVNNEGELVSLDPSSGSVHWVVNVGPEAEFGSEPTVGQDGTIFAAGETRGNFLALRPDGSIKWRFQADDRIFSSPALGEDQTLYFGDRSGDYYALNSNGTLKWKREIGGEFFGGSAIGPSGTIYSGNRNGNLYAFNPDGTTKWVFKRNDDIRSTPAIGKNGEILFGTKNKNYFYVLNPNGSVKWKYQADGPFRKQTSPSIGPKGNYYIGNDAGHLLAFTPDGQRKWTFQARGMIRFSAPLINGNGSLYFGDNSSQFYGVSASGSEKWSFGANVSALVGTALGQNGQLFVGKRGMDGNPYSDPPALMSIESESQSLAESPWPKFQHDKRNTGRADGITCDLKPRLQVFPSRLKLNRGSVMLFVNGFKDSQTSVGSIDPETVTLSDAKPKWWLTIPAFFTGSDFLILKYRRNELEIDTDSLDPRQWTKKELPVKGKLKKTGCFKASVESEVRP